MTYHNIDNSVSDQLGKTILWQYDKAVNLNRTIDFFGQFYSAAVEKFWNDYPTTVIGIDTANEMGLAAWGKFIGAPRPMYLSTASETAGQTLSVSDALYRKILKARFFLMKASGSSSDIASYLAMIFPFFGSSASSAISLIDKGDMAMEYAKVEMLSYVIPYSGMKINAGDIVAVPSIYVASEHITEGAEWKTVSKTFADIGIVSEYTYGGKYNVGDYVLHDGEAYVADIDIDYPPIEFPAEDFSKVRRVNRVFETDMDAGNVVFHVDLYVAREDFSWDGIVGSMGKMTDVLASDVVEEAETPLQASPWDCLTKEEQDLFLTATNTDTLVLENKEFQAARDLLPFPAGVKDNEFMNEVVFGFRGQEKISEDPVGTTDFGDVQVSILKGLTDYSDFNVRAGVTIIDPNDDPEVGSFHDSQVTDSWQETTFISDDIQGQLERH